MTQQTKLRVVPVALVVSSVSSRAVRLARHSQNAWARNVERVVESCPVETWRLASQVEFGHMPRSKPKLTTLSRWGIDISFRL